MLVNSNTFNIQSTITDDWGGSHRVVLDLETLATVNDWQLEISLANDYTIDQIYGAKFFQEDGKTYLSGEIVNQTFNPGDNLEIVLIIDEGNSSNQAPIVPEFLFADSINSNLNTSNQLSNIFNLNSTITDDWGGSHRLVLDLEALSPANDWLLEISQINDYQIDQIYGAELIQQDGKNYISGASWNQSLNPGDKVEIVLIIEEGNSSSQAPVIPTISFVDSINSNNNNTLKNMLVNSSIFDIETTITDDWGGSHRVVLDLEALSTTNDWLFEISQADDYTIDQIYGAELIQEDGNDYISGASWNKSLNQGDKVEVVLIVEEGNSSSQAPITPNFLFSDSNLNSNNQNADDLSTNSNAFDVQSTVTDDWGNSHRVVLDIEALTATDDWEFEISLADDYKVDQVYGAKLSQKDGKNYLSGEILNDTLNPGDKREVVLIVDEGNSSNQAPIAPEFIFADAPNSAPINSNNNNNEIVYSADDNVISVDSDFGGNLANAIAAANDGDIVQLGGKTYYTDGITIDKDITVTGQSGSVINGQGTSGSIINLTQNATGATIQNLEITNGTTGINGYRVFDLTLKNLDINNIGLNQIRRDGQHNTGIVLNRANGLQLLDSSISNVSRKGVGVNDTDGALISGLSIQNINLDAEHSQSFDAAGIKFFNTNKVTVKDSFFSDINANNIWPDTTNATTVEGNVIRNVGEDFLKPDFDDNIQITGIYNEKSSNSIIKNNEANSVNGTTAFNATEFSTETMTLIDNNFSSIAINTTDYWVNEEVEKLIAITEDPDAADFSLFEDEYFAVAIIG